MKHYKLDKRFKGYGNFKYSVDFNWREKSKYLEVRNWCWDQWGPSSEVAFLEDNQSLVSEGWSWDTSEFKNRIYLATEKEYQWFLLKWC